MKTPPFTVWLTKEWEGFWEGSCLHVDKVGKKWFYGTATDRCSSFKARFPIKLCRLDDPMDEIYKAIKREKQ